MQQNFARASQTNWTSLVLPMPMSKPIPEEVMAEVTTLSTPKKTNTPMTTISRQMSLQDECVLGLTRSKRRKIARIPEESSSPRTIATLLTPSSTPARGGKDISPRLPLPMSMVLAGQDAASVSKSESAATKSFEPLASSSSQVAVQVVAQTASKPPRHVRREQSCCDSTTMDSSILDSSLL